MTPPTILEAKKLAVDHRSVGCLVFMVGPEQFATASYGMTRRHCDAMKDVSEQIARLIREGVLVIPDALREGHR